MKQGLRDSDCIMSEFIFSGPFFRIRNFPTPEGGKWFGKHYLFPTKEISRGSCWPGDTISNWRLNSSCLSYAEINTSPFTFDKCAVTLSNLYWDWQLRMKIRQEDSLRKLEWWKGAKQVASPLAPIRTALGAIGSNSLSPLMPPQCWARCCICHGRTKPNQTFTLGGNSRMQEPLGAVQRWGVADTPLCATTTASNKPKAPEKSETWLQ